MAESNTPMPDVSFLGPDRVLDAAYALYVVDSASPEEQNAEIFHMAKHIVDDFHRLCESAAYGSPEWVFMFSLRQIMVSLAKGIGRRKRELEEQMRAAREKRDRRLRAMSSISIKAGFLRAGWHVLLWGGLGFVLTRSFIPKVNLEEHTSPTYASAAAAIACILIGSFVRARITSAQYNGIYDSCESTQLRAQTAYNKGALEEYRRAKRDAARAWERYTKQKPTEWLAFDAVLAEDLAHVQDLCEREQGAPGALAFLTPLGHWLTKYMIVLRLKRDRPNHRRARAPKDNQGEGPGKFEI